MPRLRLSTIAALLLAALVLLAAPAAQACPMCKAALAGSDSGGDLVQGFFWSILFMLSMPFALLGGFSTYMYVLVRRARREREAAGTGGDPAQPLAGQAAVPQLDESHEPIGV